MPTLTRRGFLRQLAFAAAPAVADPGASTLVCVFLRGAADTLNMLVPYADDAYYRGRPTLAIPAPHKTGAGASIRLTDFYALHPHLAPLLPAWKEGRFGAVQAVGSDDPTGSHFEAQDQIEHGASHGQSLGGGWLGRHLRSRAGSNDSPLAAVAIGPSLPESLRGAPSASAIRSIDEVQLPAAAGDAKAVASALSALYAAEVDVLGQQGRETLDLLRRVEKLHGQPYQPEPGVEYPPDAFGTGLREVARIIKAGLGLEVACVDLGGWDTHFFQGTTAGLQAGLIETLAKGLAAFDADMRAHRDRVTTIVMTEFGRRLYENGSAGTDHGRGFAFFGLGGKVNGGQVHGQWPGVEPAGIPNIPGPGGMTVKVDYRSVLSEVLEKGTGNIDVGQVFPGFEARRVGLVGPLVTG